MGNTIKIEAFPATSEANEYNVRIGGLVIVVGQTLEAANALVEKLKSDSDMVIRMRANAILPLLCINSLSSIPR